MRRILAVVLSLALVVGITSTTSADESRDEKDTRPTINRARVEANLLIGIQSENFGLRTGSAMMLGDIQSTSAVSPLMNMLRHETDERARIVAALSLYKIGDPVGIDAIRQAAQLDESARVRKLCTLFYNEYKKNSGKG